MNISKNAQNLIDTGRIHSNGMESKALTMASRAIGKSFSIRLSKTTIVKGVISKCEINELRANGSSIYTTWNVWMECGFAKVTKGPYVMKSIPQ